MSATILEGNVFDILPTIAPGSVDCVCTSPPYWKLRSYLPKDHALKPLELGSERTPVEFIGNLVRLFGLVRDVLADHGTVWLNIGDSYSTGGSGSRTNPGTLRGTPNSVSTAQGDGRKDDSGIDSGNLCLIPQRLAIALQDDGWLVRSVICWCLSPSTRVYARTATTEGPATLHDLIRLDPATVKLWTGQQWTRVRGWSKSRCEHPIRLTLRSGETIGTTPNHEWPLTDGRLVRSDALKVGDVLATCKLPDPNFKGGDGIDTDLAWLAGLYLAEGNIWEDAIHLAGNANETERHDKVWRIAAKFGGSSTLLAEDGDSVRQTLHGDILHGAIRHFVTGKGAHNKHLHPRCWALSNKLLQAFLDGYLAGDGHRDPNNDRWRLTFCKNDAWAADIRTLAARLGATLTIKPSYARMGRAKTFEAYRGELRFTRSGHPSEKERAEIMEIDSAPEGDYIDVGVENDSHLFALASGVLTHNSKPAPMPASLAGWAWRRCRVKKSNGNGYSASKGSPRANGTVQRNPDSSRNPDLQAKWSDCPGCRKCSPNGGYVLRKGSWRPTSSWEPILMLAKQPGYYADGEAVKQPAAAATVSRDQYTRVLDDPDEQFAVRHDHETICDGANLRDVWSIAAEPLKEKHYAAFPTELVSRCLRAGTSAKGYCPTCGKPWARVIDPGKLVGVDRGGNYKGQESEVDAALANRMGGTLGGYRPGMSYENNTIGWRASCRCPAAEPRPGVVLDPFSGSGRTGIQAMRLGLDYIGCELNPAYVEMSRRLLYDANPLFCTEE